MLLLLLLLLLLPPRIYFVRRANKQHARVYITLTSYQNREKVRTTVGVL
jgi:hypothetical protein